MTIRLSILTAPSILALMFFGIPQQETPSTSATAPAASTQTATPPAPTAAKPAPPVSEPGISEEEIRHLLLGKNLFLRGFYLSDDLNYNEHGKLVGNSPVGSFTLAAIQIERVRLIKHKLELEGTRYALHYTGTLAAEGGQNAYDRISITPRKKFVRITIDREQVVTPKKKKEKKEAPKVALRQTATASGPTSAKGTVPAAIPAAPQELATKQEPSEDNEATLPMTAETTKVAEDEAKKQVEEEAKKEKPEEKAADPNSVTTTISPAHSATVLREALKKVFSEGIDDELLASLPDFWKNYYMAAEEKRDFIPSDTSITRLNSSIRPPRLLTHLEAESNEYAQQNEISGLAQYHVVLGADGVVKEIAASRPIGFGLDENAASAIRKAHFEPATKAGVPVPVLIDITVPFRIYSQRTSVNKSNPQAGTNTPAPAPAISPIPADRPTYK